MPPTRHSDASRPRLAHTPLHHPTPKVARNSATRKFNTAHKRCNPNGLVSKFERFTWNYVRHFSATTPNGARTHPHTPTHANAAPRDTEPRTATSPRPRHARAPTPPKSHVIRLPENSAPPTNVAIPTVQFHSLKGLHGNYVRHFSATTPNGARTHPHTPTHANAAPHHRTSGHPPPRPGLVASTRHRAPASSRASTHTPAQ